MTVCVRDGEGKDAVIISLRARRALVTRWLTVVDIKKPVSAA